MNSKNKEVISIQEIKKPLLDTPIGRILIPFLSIWGTAVTIAFISHLITGSLQEPVLIGLQMMAVLIIFPIDFIMIKRSRRNKRIQIRGMRATCQIEKIEYKSQNKGNGRYYIICRGRNPVTGISGTYKSPAFCGNPEVYLDVNQIQMMPVCFDEKGQHYHMDISGIARTRAENAIDKKRLSSLKKINPMIILMVLFVILVPIATRLNEDVETFVSKLFGLLICLLIGSAFIALAVYYYRQEIKKRETYSECAMATIVRNKKEITVKQTYNYFPVVSFMTLDGQTHTASYNYGMISPVEEGSVRKIFYNKKKPEEFYFDDNTTLKSVRIFTAVLLGIGAIPLMIAVFLMRTLAI